MPPVPHWHTPHGNGAGGHAGPHHPVLHRRPDRAIDQTLATLEQQLSGLITLSPSDKQRIPKLGDKYDTFCRHTLEALADNPQLLPPTLDVAAAQQGLSTRDQLRPRLMRMEVLLRKGNDTLMALGSDAYTAASRGYGLLKLLGRANGLDPVRKDLGTRFTKTPRATPKETKAA